MISKNYDLFAGVDGVPAAQSQDAFTVRLCGCMGGCSSGCAQVDAFICACCVGWTKG
jgi:hypothetical protein